MMQDWRSNVIGKIAENQRLRGVLGVANLAEVNAQDIRLDDTKDRGSGEGPRQLFCQGAVKFDRYQTADARDEQFGQGAPARPDLDHKVAWVRLKRFQDVSSIVRVLKEMLTKFRAMAGACGFTRPDKNQPSF
jgi:hypothetical protein